MGVGWLPSQSLSLVLWLSDNHDGATASAQLVLRVSLV